MPTSDKGLFFFADQLKQTFADLFSSDTHKVKVLCTFGLSTWLSTTFGCDGIITFSGNFLKTENLI